MWKKKAIKSGESDGAGHIMATYPFYYLFLSYFFLFFSFFLNPCSLTTLPCHCSRVYRFEISAPYFIIHTKKILHFLKSQNLHFPPTALSWIVMTRENWNTFKIISIASMHKFLIFVELLLIVARKGFFQWTCLFVCFT